MLQPRVPIVITAKTRLSELRRLLEEPVFKAQARERLVRSVEQSLRVEGYTVSHEEALAAAERILGP